MFQSHSQKRKHIRRKMWVNDQCGIIRPARNAFLGFLSAFYKLPADGCVPLQFVYDDISDIESASSQICPPVLVDHGNL